MDQNQIAQGTEVLSADGEKLGKVVSIEQGYLVVEKGFFFPTDYYVPTSAVANYDGTTAYLNVSKDQALASGWDQRGTGTTTTTVTGTDTSRTGDDWSATATAAADYRSTAVAGGDNLVTNQTKTLDADDNIVVPVHEEELVATKREREAGEVRITKNVVEEARTLEVPVTEEHVRVTRRAVDREGAMDTNAFQGGTIEVPLTTEEVELQKRVRVAEEVEIDKEAVQSTQSVQGTVRKEVVNVDEATAQQTGARTYRDADVTTTGSATTGSATGGEGLLDKAAGAVEDVTRSKKSKKG